MTPWAEDLDPADPLPEYPRPQLVRSAWQSLNGPWQFAALERAGSPLPATWTETVIVPFPIESVLSGIERHEDHVAYRRTFTVPEGWGIGGPSGQRLLLNFGAVDNEATVAVNGRHVGHHVGGYDAFSVDITDALRPGENELVVRVTDTTGDTPKGKQSPDPSGIFYTPASGIWQTVWLEPVSRVHVRGIRSTPVLADAGDELQVTVDAEGVSAAARSMVEVLHADGTPVVEGEARPGTTVTLPLGSTRRWTPDDPYLYTVTVTLVDGRARDTVRSYAGIRSVGVQRVDGVNRIVLNGQRIFLLSTLDQGYWPDGVYTAPTDQALAWDIEETRALGFNTIRKHIKVEPARWYHHADRLGMLVWQDMPSAFTSRDTQSTSAAVTDQWERELHTMIDQHVSSPAVIGWIPFNEGWSEWDLAETARVARAVRAQDPSRLLDTHSGVDCPQSLGDSGTGDVIDHHAYTGPASPAPDATRAAIDGEHGGYSLSIAGHVWPGGSVNPYGEVGSPAALTNAYVANTAHLVGPAGETLSGSVYTQLTDVEGEVNGLWTYDRRIPKVDRARVRTVNLSVLAAGADGPAASTPGGPLGG